MGALVINYEAELTSTNGQVYSAATAPVIINTGAAGYGTADNSLVSTAHAAEGYINVSIGNLGKQDTATIEMGEIFKIDRLYDKQIKSPDYSAVMEGIKDLPKSKRIKILGA